MVSGLWHPANCYGFPTSTRSCQNVTTWHVTWKQNSERALLPPAAVRGNCCQSLNRSLLFMWLNLCKTSKMCQIVRYDAHFSFFSLELRRITDHYQLFSTKWHLALLQWFHTTSSVMRVSIQAANRHHDRPSEPDVPGNRRIQRSEQPPLWFAISRLTHRHIWA